MNAEELKARITAKEDELRPEQSDLTASDLRWLAFLHVFLETSGGQE